MNMKASFDFCLALASTLGLTSTMLAVPNPLVQANTQQGEASPKSTEPFRQKGPLTAAHRNAVRSLTSPGPQLAVNLSTAGMTLKLPIREKPCSSGTRVHSIIKGKWEGAHRRAMRGRQGWRRRSRCRLALCRSHRLSGDMSISQIGKFGGVFPVRRATRSNQLPTRGDHLKTSLGPSRAILLKVAITGCLRRQAMI